MKLKLTKAACDAMYPTRRTGNAAEGWTDENGFHAGRGTVKKGKRTEVPLLDRDVAEGEVVTAPDTATSMDLVLSGLMEPADAGSKSKLSEIAAKEFDSIVEKAEALEQGAKKDDRELSNKERRQISELAARADTIRNGGVLADSKPAPKATEPNEEKA